MSIFSRIFTWLAAQKAEPLIFTPSLFFKHSVCPHWIWHDRNTDPKKKGEVPALAEKLLEQGVLHEEEYVQGLVFEEVKEKRAEQAFAETVRLMKAGVELIYQGAIECEIDGVIYRGRPDLLEKKRGRASAFGDWYYAPVDIKSSTKIKPQHWMQLTLYARILEDVQGVFPEEAAIINREHERLPIVIGEKHRAKTFAEMDDILRVMKGEKPGLRLTSSCKGSPWYGMCVSEAEAANDIALLYRLDSRSLEALREAGVRTVSDAAEMDVDALPKIPYASLETLERVKLQAEALRDGELRWLATPELPERTLNIYFDIEGDPLLDVQYLWGFWVVGDAEGKYAQIGEVRWHEDGKYFVYFLAEQIEDEREMWGKFLAWIELLPEDMAVFHYNRYEETQCKSLSEYYGGSAALNRFRAQMIDLELVVRESVIFPLYFYSIKDIAKSKFLNYTWRHAKAGGAQSIFWYEEWLEKGDRKILDDIVNYNEDDVQATEALHRWLIG